MQAAIFIARELSPELFTKENISSDDADAAILIARELSPVLHQGELSPVIFKMQLVNFHQSCNL